MFLVLNLICLPINIGCALDKNNSLRVFNVIAIGCNLIGIILALA